MSLFDASLFEQLRIARQVTWGRPLRVHALTSSTNDLALEAAAGAAKTGIVFVAEQQSKGRGRRGLPWQGPRGECLMFSTLLRLPSHKNSGYGLSLAVGLALRDAVAPHLPTEKLVKVKWPNDLYVDDRKLAGVLIEARRSEGSATQEGTGPAVVIGVGLNLSTRAFPPELSHATSLSLLGADLPRVESLLLDILGALERRCMQFLTKGLSSITDELSTCDALLGKELLIDGRPYLGDGIDDQGRLLVRDADGTVHALTSAHVEFPRPRAHFTAEIEETNKGSASS